MHTLAKNSNSKPAKSTEELKQIMQEILACARKQGATDAAVDVSNSQGFSATVRMQEVETIEFGDDKSVSVTVYFGQRKGSASTTDTSSASIEKMVSAACDIAKVSAEDPCFGLADKQLIDNQYPDLDLYHPWVITPSDAIEKALACEAYALKNDKRITNSDGVSLSTYNISHGYANTNGCEGVLMGSRHQMSCSLVAQQHDKMQTDYDYTASRYPEGLVDMETLASSAAERVLGRLGARKIKTQKSHVVFSSRLSNTLLSAFISAISGTNLYRKNSFLLDGLDKAIFPETIKIYEQPHLLGGLGSSPFDDEGVPTRHNVFVEQGLLRQYVLGSYSARKLGMQTTANAGGVFNLTIDPTSGGLADILKMMGTGLLVTELMGSGTNILTGDYSRGARGFWIENGNIQFPVEEITIAGNLKTMFKSIRAVGDDINPNIATRCGSIFIESMMIAGN